MFEFLDKIRIIQGGMGVYISSPPLVRAFSEACEELGVDGLGTVSGTAADRIMVAILQRGDPGGHYRRALDHFPFQDVAKRVLSEYYDPTGNGTKTAPVYRIDPTRSWIELAVTASFAFVWLSKEGHNRPVSVNFLEKISLPLIYFLFGAILAGVDVVSMGAGVVRFVPDVIDALLRAQTLRYPIPVIETDGSHGTIETSFNPWEFFKRDLPPMKRPAFLPIVASNVLAEYYADKIPAHGRQGFVVEGKEAGGHNAPPRGKVTLDHLGQPIYGPRDEVDFKKLIKLGLPIWVGGGYASRKGLAEAEALGAQGIQVGTLFAFCEESGMSPLIRREALRLAYRGELQVLRNRKVSPTGYPFNVACLPDTLSDPDVYEREIRLCDQGALVVCYRKSDGTIGYRCPSEPVDRFVAKGGEIGDTDGRCCLCSALIAATGLLNHLNTMYSGRRARSPIITLGQRLDFVRDLIRDENGSYRAKDALRYLCGF